MTFPLFTSSPACSTRLKCHMCRDAGAIGKQFREAHAVNHEMPGLGLFPCPFNVDPATVKPIAYEPPPQLVPTAEEQAAWWKLAEPHCVACPSFGGEVLTPDNKITRKVACASCQTCGSKTVGPLQDCPLGKWKREDLKMFDSGMVEGVVRQAVERAKTSP